MSGKTISKVRAREQYGEAFVRMLMRGKDEITLTTDNMILLEKWKMMRANMFVPFNFNYVYMIENGRGHFKIGYTARPRHRFSSLVGSGADDLKMAGVVVCQSDSGRNIERAVQTMLTKMGAHHRREWFTGTHGKHWPIIADFVKARYQDKIFGLSQAWEGCEPLLKLYIAAHNGEKSAIDVEAARADFLWIVDLAENGLTVAA